MSSVKSYNNGSVNTSAYPAVNAAKAALGTAVKSFIAKKAVNSLIARTGINTEKPKPKKSFVRRMVNFGSGPTSTPGKRMENPGAVTNPIYDPNSGLTTAQKAKQQELAQVIAFQEQEDKKKTETARATAEAISNASAKKYFALAAGIILVIAAIAGLWFGYISNHTTCGRDAGKSSDAGAGASGDFEKCFSSYTSYGKSSK